MKKIIISLAMLALVACSDSTSSSSAAVEQEEELYYCEADGHYYMHKEDYDDFCGKFDWENSPFVWEDDEDEDGSEDAEGDEE